MKWKRGGLESHADKRAKALLDDSKLSKQAAASRFVVLVVSNQKYMFGLSRRRNSTNLSSTLSSSTLRSSLSSCPTAVAQSADGAAAGLSAST